jgi:S1-C subfamily serine protease
MLGEQSATGAPDRTGALVLAVAPDSKAAHAGLQKGDLIHSVDVVKSTFPVTDAPTLLVLQASHKWQQRLHINVLRQQKMLKLQVPYE